MKPGTVNLAVNHNQTIHPLRHKWIPLLISVLMIISLVSCIRPTQPPLPTATLTIEKTPDSGDLSECLAVYSDGQKEQIGFRDIYPGKTRASELAPRIGNPGQKVDLDRFIGWNYEKFTVYSNRFTDDIVLINTYLIDLEPQDLSNILNTNGCPDTILVSTGEEEINDSADLIQFVYLDQGMIFKFGQGTPVWLSDVPVSIDYFPPMTLKEFKDQNYSGLASTCHCKTLDWNEAVQ